MFWGKTIVYIDNSNIYRGGKDAGWLPEYEKLMHFLETLGGQLWDVHFFAIEESSASRTSTSDFFDYLQKGLGFKLHLYTYGNKSIRCVHCNRFSQITVEKGLDVGITTQILRDFHNKAFDTMILMSSNRDYIELLDFVRQSGKKVKLLIWRNTMSQDLTEFTNKWAIEVIYLDNHRHELEKELSTCKEATDYPVDETQEIKKPLVSSSNLSDSKRMSEVSPEIKPEDLPHGGLSGPEQTGNPGTPLG